MKITASVNQQLKTIMYGADFGGNTKLENHMTRELENLLNECKKTGIPLKVYAGYDPSKPDLHIGHSISLKKLRQFQDFGHDVYFLVGTFTAQVGDASDKLTKNLGFKPRPFRATFQ